MENEHGAYIVSHEKSTEQKEMSVRKLELATSFFFLLDVTAAEEAELLALGMKPVMLLWSPGGRGGGRGIGLCIVSVQLVVLYIVIHGCVCLHTGPDRPGV